MDTSFPSASAPADDVSQSVRPTTAIGWREFLRGLAEELDAVAGPAGRDSLLHATGCRMARLLPLPAAASMQALEIEMNETLAAIGWGSVKLSLLEAERCLILSHTGLPRIGAAGDPPGQWLAAALEGLYETWMAQQPSADASFTARRQGGLTGECVVLRYGRLSG
jgi:hypothetical protein